MTHTMAGVHDSELVLVQQQDGSQMLDEAAIQGERWRREAGILATPPGGHFPMQNAAPLTFETPQVPVIFVLGGPGSGKVTHCDNLTQEKKGIVHINMTDLLQQYALGNEMQDFGLLSSKTVTEVLMLEMKMSLGAKTFLVSGYPRNMRDVVEYSEKIQIVNGVVLIQWRPERLEKQIEYGAQLGHVIIELARMELQNFYKNVMPVVDYFDQSDMLVELNGERDPAVVYVDFRRTVFHILGLPEDDTSSNRQAQNSMEAEVEVVRDQNGVQTSPEPKIERAEEVKSTKTPPESPPPEETITNLDEEEIMPAKTADIPKKRLPPIVWVLGGPGSNKGLVCELAIQLMANKGNWVHISVSNELMTMAANSTKIKEQLANGDYAPTELVLLLVEKQILLNRDCDGIIVDGFPKNITQQADFENKFGQRPELLLLDVAKQHSNRKKPYDSPDPFLRRLELFRREAMPMLKGLDAEGRVTVLDGDTELPADRQQFADSLLKMMRRAARHEQEPTRNNSHQLPNGYAKPPHANGVLANGSNSLTIANGKSNGEINELEQLDSPQRIVANGVAGSGRGNLAKTQLQRMQGTATKASNGIGPTTKIKSSSSNNKPQQNGNAIHMLQNGVVSGTTHRIGNGYLPRAPSNKVGPSSTALSNNNTRNNSRSHLHQNGGISVIDPLRRMYTEIDDQPPTQLHI
ncbi:hypothetical protein QAD02_015642 [Eretmocerus hayati]|uniref:Uncharacterized protein n=1 Tax=Eretmocerus hayati TaxID=131215 RepID=A0ACC2P8D3_9HYME|nr:hypothetical protein QAD02_015642 [Eretmocerus hayati]